MQNDNPKKMSLTSDSDSDPIVTDWNKELIYAIRQEKGESEKDPEQHRLYRINTCLSERADINTTHGKNHDTILHTAIKKNYQKIVALLIERGARTDITNKKGLTAITLAETLGNEAMVSILNNQQLKPAVNESPAASQPQSVDDQQPSTSRETTFPLRDISSMRCVDNQGVDANRVILGSKRKPITDCEDHQRIKKRRFELHNVRPHESQSSCGSSLDSGRRCPGENPNPEEDESGIIQNQSSRFDREMTYSAGGLKSSFHGVVYQLKHLGFTLLRAMQPQQEISFLLSTERVDVGKFDDLVLEYRDNQGKDVDLFLQLKHSRSVGRQVNAYDLLEKEDGDFFVPKYFMSWREIKKSPLFSDKVSRNVVLGTNIGLNLEGLKNAEISFEEVSKPVECLEMIGTKEETTCYKLTANVQSNRKIYAKLKETSDVYMLARELAEHVVQAKKMTLVGMFKQYHTALGEHVIDTKNKKFLQNFIKNKDLHPKTRDFRKIFFVEFSKLKSRLSKQVAEDVIWKEVEDSPLELSKNFGETFKLPVEPRLTDVTLFSQEFVKLLNNATTDNVVKISKNIYRKNARKGSVERVVADNIDKLAGHVLITKCGKIKFRTQFFDDSIQSSGNIGEFKDSLKSQLGSMYDELDRFEIEINNFETCEEEELYPNTELPDGDMAEVDITEFLNVFILAVNLPDEVELGEMITYEIGDDSKFNLLDADLIGRTFLTKIVDWFKEKGKKVGEGEYLSYRGGEVFFMEMENQINTLKSMGVTSVYWEELMEYDVDFECENTKLKAFLSENEPNPTLHRILMLMAPKEPLLTALRVRQALVQVEKFARNDSFIFIRLRTLLLRGIKDQVIRAFQSQRSHHLLVIECDSASMKQNLRGLWLSLCKAAENIKDANKTVILIVRGDKDLATSFAGQFKRVYRTHIQEDDDISFEHLTEGSQLKLMEKRVVNFQGYGDRISFGRLLGVEVDNIGINRSKDVAEIIDANTLVSLIRSDDEMRIGNDLEGLGKIADYYIKRSIIQYIVIKEDILKDQRTSDLLAVSAIDKELQASLGRMDEAALTARNLGNLTILNSEYEVEQFKTLCEKNMHHNIHWLKKESGRFVWKQSVGDISHLLRYRDVTDNNDIDNRAVAIYLNEDQFAAHDGPVIVSDIAGMGKSTMLTNLAGIIKKNDPSLLVLKIDLNRYTTALAEVKRNSDYNLGIINNAVEFLVNKLLDLQTNLEKKVFKAIIEKQRKVALIFDGFDEISPTYEHIVNDLLQALAKHRMKQLFIATRPHTRGTLENKLNTFSYQLQPLSTVNQEDFLIRFWKNGLGLDESDQEMENDTRHHAQEIMKRLALSINDGVNKFTGIPIQTKLVAEICQNFIIQRRGKLKNSTNNQSRLPDKIDLLYLYQHFVDMKFEIFFKKRGGNLEDPAVLEGKKLRYDTFIDAHEKLALDVLFDEDKVKELLPFRRDVKRESNIVEERTGIITQFINGKPLFGHRTYAEYFAAKFLSEKLKEHTTESVRQIFVKDIFLGENYQNLRAFMNCLLSDEHNNSFEGDSWKSYLIAHRNSMNRTVFHVAAVEGNDLFVRLFLNCLSKKPKDLKALIDAEDGYGRTAVYWAARYGFLKEIKLLVKNGDGKVDKCSEADGETPLFAATSTGQLDVIKYLLDKKANVNAQTNDGRTPLFIATFTGKLDIMAHLIDNKANVNGNFPTNGRITPLHMAAFTGKSDVVKYLLDNKADVDAQTIDGRTPLYVAAMAGKLDVVQYLLDNKANAVSRANDGQTPLHVAASAGRLNIVKYLLDTGITVDIKANDGRTPLHVAAVAGKLDVVKYLIDNQADVNSRTNDGGTPLHAAAVAGELDVVKYFIENNADIDAQTDNGWTPLHAATLVAKLNVVQYLLEKKAKVNSRTNNGDTPLHAATFVGDLDIMKSLLDKGAEVDSQTNDGKTPLDGAAFAGNLNLVIYLLEKNANVNSRSKDGETPLHTAAFNAKLDVVKYLIDTEADVNSRTNDGHTPLYAATVAGKFDIVMYLLEKGADVNSQTSHGITALHAAAFTGQLDIAKYLLDKKADVNSQTNDGKTPLHIAAFNGKLDIVEHLLYKGASVNLRTINGDTPLHAAAVVGNLSVVKCLLDYKADVNSQANDGQKPLHLATSAGKLDVVQYLLDKHADVGF